MDVRSAEALERIATAQLVMAVIMVLVGLAVIGAVVVLLLQVRAARRQLEKTVEELKPRVAPLIDRAKDVTGDVAGMTDNVRRKVDDVLHTVEDLNRSLKRGSAATEERLRRFTAVLDLVQEEAEELLLDAAATARGVHETARVLREPRRSSPGRARIVPADPDELRDTEEEDT